MRRVLTAIVTLSCVAGPALASAQVSIFYQRRTKKTFLQVTVGYPGPSPWSLPCHGSLPAYPILVPVAYPIGNPWTIEPQPTFPASPSPLLPPTPPGLASKYSQYLPPGSLTKSPARSFEVRGLVDRGRSRLKAGDAAGALDAFRDALLRGPDDPALEALFALALTASKDFVHADKAARSALAQAAAKDVLIEDPAAAVGGDSAWQAILKNLEAEKGAVGKLALALLRASSGEKAKARAALDKLLSTSPEDSVLKKLRAVVATD